MVRKDISCAIPTPRLIMRRPPSYLFIKYHITLKFPTGLIIRPHVYWVISGGVTAITSPSHSWTYLLIPPPPPSPPFTSISTLEHHYCFDLWWPSSAHLGLQIYLTQSALTGLTTMLSDQGTVSPSAHLIHRSLAGVF